MTLLNAIIIAALAAVALSLLLSAIDPEKDTKPDPRYHPRRNGMVDWSFWPEERERQAQKKGWSALRNLLWICSVSLFLAVVVIFVRGY